MYYQSTRGESNITNFEEVLLSGLASDGGLFLPVEFPKLNMEEINNLSKLSYEELAVKLISLYTGDLFCEQEIRTIVEKSYSKFTNKIRSPITQLNENHFILELFHGPTLAFKDFAMQIISKMFDIVLNKKNKKISIITATSGDTGSAAVEAFKNSNNANLFVLFPYKRISELQRKQMTTVRSPNTKIFAVKGTFDDCQALVKNLFKDKNFRDEVNLSGVNSINWARVLAQVVYYFSAYLQIQNKKSDISFSVPTGNFGDAYAGFVAKKMGLPIKKIIIATNQNDILDRLLVKGEYVKGKVQKTLSPSMDIQVASNFERLLFDTLIKNSKEVVRLMDLLETKDGFRLSSFSKRVLDKDFSSGSSTDTETLKIIHKYYRSNNIILCPHSAIGVKVGEENRNEKNVIISLATAHPGKFKDTVEKALGEPMDLPEALKKVIEKKEIYKTVALDKDLIANEIRREFFK